MSSIGNVIGEAVGAVVGATNSGTTLKDFLSKFSSSEGKWINTIDPFATFDVSIRFYPCEAQPSLAEEKSLLSKLGDTAMSFAKSAVKNAANNITGGLLGSIMNGRDRVDVMKQHDSFEFAHKETFLEYLAAANLLVGAEDWIGEKAGQIVRPLEL